MRCACCNVPIPVRDGTGRYDDLCQVCEREVRQAVEDTEGYPELAPENYIFPIKIHLPEE